MRIQKINTDTAEWEDITEPERWIRLVVNGTWFDVQERDGEYVLRVSCNGRINITPEASNVIVVSDANR